MLKGNHDTKNKISQSLSHHHKVQKTQ